ncbi:MAG: Ig-like domain-containing protein, partial [Candidatus Hodarchaeota archaeon]
DASAWIELISGWTTTSYEWDTTLVSDGEFYQVRIVANDSALTGEDESDGSFTIDNPDAPIVTVTYPNGGEALSGTVTITWDASDLDGDSLTYSVYYWDASAWIELISGWTTTSYEWDTTLVSNGEFYQVRIVANDSALTGKDESDGSFTIDNPNAPIVTVTYPNGGETLSGTVTITWDASDPDGDSLTYTIYYWDSGVWIELVSGWSATSYEWDTTAVSDGEFYQVRIKASDGALTDEDESDESFTVDNEPNSTTTITTSITTTTTSTKTPSGFEVTLVMLILLFGGLTIILIRKKRS